MQNMACFSLKPLPANYLWSVSNEFDSPDFLNWTWRAASSWIPNGNNSPYATSILDLDCFAGQYTRNVMGTAHYSTANGGYNLYSYLTSPTLGWQCA